MPTITEPIYVVTYFLQRMEFPNLQPGEMEVTPRPEKNFYRILPGRKVELWLYNQANARYQLATDYRSGAEVDQDPHYEAMEFWQPIEMMAALPYSFYADNGGDWAGAASTDPTPGALLNIGDIIKIKFINDVKLADADGNPSPCGVFTTTDLTFALNKVAGM